MSTTNEIRAPEDCPTPEYHATHYYCPSCSWTAPDAPVSAESRLIAELAEANDANSLCGRNLELAEAERDRYRKALEELLRLVEERRVIAPNDGGIYRGAVERIARKALNPNEAEER